MQICAGVRKSNMHEGERRPLKVPPSMGVTSACGEAEMCAVRSLVYPLDFRGFFAVVARRGVWRLPVFFVAAGASDSGEG